MKGFGPHFSSFAYFSFMLYIVVCDPRGTSQGSDHIVSKARVNSLAIWGTASLFTSLTPGFSPMLQIITTSYVLPPSCTFIVQVVQPRVWPGVKCATSVEPPRVTSSPSCSTLSIGWGFPPGVLGPR